MNVRYFDNAATTRVKDEVLEEMLPYLKENLVIHLLCIQLEEKLKRQ